MVRLSLGAALSFEMSMASWICAALEATVIEVEVPDIVPPPGFRSAPRVTVPVWLMAMAPPLVLIIPPVLSKVVPLEVKLPPKVSIIVPFIQTSPTPGAGSSPDACMKALSALRTTLRGASPGSMAPLITISLAASKVRVSGVTKLLEIVAPGCIQMSPGAAGTGGEPEKVSIKTLVPANRAALIAPSLTWELPTNTGLKVVGGGPPGSMGCDPAGAGTIHTSKGSI